MNFNNIRKVRTKFNMNQAEFWNPVGVQQTTASRYESGERPIPKPVRLLLLIAYGTRQQGRRELDKLGAWE
jgi:DNA-binding transcriptional regulator YiaG